MATTTRRAGGPPYVAGDLPAALYYSGLYDDQAAYSPGAVVLSSSHIYVCKGYVPQQTGEASNTAPADDGNTWDLLL